MKYQLLHQESKEQIKKIEYEEIERKSVVISKYL